MKVWGRENPSPPAYSTLLFICCGIAFTAYLGSYMRIPVVPLFARSLGASTVEVGIINAAFLLSAGLLSLPLGILSDRWGRKPLIIWGLAISLATSLLLYVSRSPGQLIWIYLIFGAGLAAVGPTLMSYAADISPSTHLGRTYGWYTTAMYCGMSLGPAVGGLIAQGWGFRPLFLVTGAFIFLIVWLVVFALPETGAAPGRRPGPRQVPGQTRGLLKNRPLLGCWLATLGGCFGLGMFVTFSPLHAHQHGVNVGQIGLIFTAQAVTNALCRIPFGRLTDRVQSRVRLAFLGFLAFAASLAGFGLSETLPQFFLAAAALGIAMALAFTPLGALVAETVAPEFRGLAMGGYNTCIYLEMMLSSALMGEVVERLGFDGGYILTTLVIFLASGIFLLLVQGFTPPPLAGKEEVRG
jgi:MFS family permease